MGLFNDMVEGFATGVGLAMAERSAFGAGSANQGTQLVRACCAQLGWGIDERLGDTGFVLHFKDPLVGTRKLSILVSDAGHIALFAVFSAANSSSHLASPEVLAYLLRRNREMSFPAWQVSNEQGVRLSLTYCLPVSGLSPSFFKFLCAEMCREVYDFDARLRQAGVL